MSMKSLDFLIVTYCGTHVRCSAPTVLDKDEWLSALHAGLEGSIMENRIETFVVLRNRHRRSRDDTFGLSRQRSDVSDSESNSGDPDSLNKPDMIVQSAVASTLSAFEDEMSSRPFVPALPRVDGRKLKKSTSTLGDDSSATVFLAKISAFAIGGIFIGSALSKRIDGAKLKPAFGWFILVMGIYIIIKETIIK